MRVRGPASGPTKAGFLGFGWKGFVAMTQVSAGPGHEEGFVDVAGARGDFEHAGSGRPALLIHGQVGSSANWRQNIDALAVQASVYAIDLVNMGKSQRVG